MYDDFYGESSGSAEPKVSKQKKNKGKANGFLKFMLEYRRKEAAQGNDLDMISCQSLAGDLWNNMSLAQRAQYENKPTTSKFPRKEHQKYTSFGVSFESIDRKKKEEAARVRNMDITIEDMLQTALEQNRLKTTTFYFFSASYFVQTLHSDIFPAEIAVSKFSLIDGVYDALHMLVNPGELPLGHASEAKSHSENSHRRPLPPKIEGETDYSVIFKKLQEFLTAGDARKNRLPILFVEPGMRDEDYKAAKLTLDKIVREADRQIEFRLFPIEHLVFKLYKKCVEGTDKAPFTSILHAKETLHQDKFMYSDIGCEFHRAEDCNLHCCLSKVRRWGYTISILCLSSDDLIRGHHFPESETVVDEADECTSVSDLQWDSYVTESFSQLRLQSETTRPNQPSAVVSARTSAVSFVSKEGSKIDQTCEKPLNPIDSTISISEMIKKASTANSLRHRDRQT